MTLAKGLALTSLAVLILYQPVTRGTNLADLVPSWRAGETRAVAESGAGPEEELIAFQRVDEMRVDEMREASPRPPRPHPHAPKPDPRSGPPARPSPPSATAPPGPFDNYPPGAAAVGGAAAGAVAADTIESVLTADVAASPLLHELLSRSDYSGSPVANWELVWQKGGYPSLKVIPDFDPNDVSAATPDGIRKVDVTFVAQSDGSMRGMRGPFRKTAKSTWTFDYRNYDNDKLSPMTMRVYFVGERFRGLRLFPNRARGTIRTHATGNGAFDGLDLGEMELEFHYRNARNQVGVLTGTTQRLILDPEGMAFFAFVICDGNCPAPPAPVGTPPDNPEPPAPEDYGFEIVFRDATTSDDITDRATVAELLGTEAFIRCLREAEIEVEIERDRRNGEHYATATIFRPECLSEADNVEYDPVDRRAVVSVGATPSRPPPASKPEEPLIGTAGDPPKGFPHHPPDVAIEQPRPGFEAPTPRPTRDPCDSARTDPGIDWRALGLPGCARSLDYLACGIRGLASDARALEERFAPVRERIRALSGDAQALCAAGTGIEDDLIRLGELDGLLQEGRKASDGAWECFTAVDDWLGTAFHCESSACDRPADRAVREFILRGAPDAEARLVALTRALDTMESDTRTLRRLLRGYNRLCDRRTLRGPDR